MAAKIDPRTRPPRSGDVLEFQGRFGPAHWRVRSVDRAVPEDMVELESVTDPSFVQRVAVGLLVVEASATRVAQPSPTSRRSTQGPQ